MSLSCINCYCTILANDWRFCGNSGGQTEIVPLILRDYTKRGFENRLLWRVWTWPDVPVILSVFWAGRKSGQMLNHSNSIRGQNANGLLCIQLGSTAIITYSDHATRRSQFDVMCAYNDWRWSTGPWCTLRDTHTHTHTLTLTHAHTHTHTDTHTHTHTHMSTKAFLMLHHS